MTSQDHYQDGRWVTWLALRDFGCFYRFALVLQCSVVLSGGQLTYSVSLTHTHTRTHVHTLSVCVFALLWEGDLGGMLEGRRGMNRLCMSSHPPLFTGHQKTDEWTWLSQLPLLLVQVCVSAWKNCAHSSTNTHRPLSPPIRQALLKRRAGKWQPWWITHSLAALSFVCVWACTCNSDRYGKMTKVDFLSTTTVCCFCLFAISHWFYFSNSHTQMTAIIKF